jgi:hypothetical protein
MKLREIIDTLNLAVRAAPGNVDAEVTSGYASDLLSDVIAHGREGDLWITLQAHPNIVAVASMKGLSGIVLINSREPEEDTLKKAEEEQMPIMVSNLPAFELIGKLYTMGISGSGNGA